MSMRVCTYCPDDMSQRVLIPGIRFWNGRTTAPYRQYCDPITMNDIVEMRLDMKSNEKYGTLSFIINGDDKGIICDDIDLDLKYRLRIIYKEVTIKLLPQMFLTVSLCLRHG